MTEPSGGLRVLRPAPHLLAFYAGRSGTPRSVPPEPTWFDEADRLGCCSYAVVEGAEALVYDTQMSLAHAATIRRVLEGAGVRSIRVVLSHWHADHVAGNAVFADRPILANRRTAALLEANREAFAAGSPPIGPLVGPTEIFEDALDLRVGTILVQARRFDIHSEDGTVLLLPGTGHLLAGDTLEDPITYVTEPDRLERHLLDLDRLAAERFERILPNHGAPDVIAAGGYPRPLLDATRHYVGRLLHCPGDPALARQDLAAFIAEDLAAGTLRSWPAYEQVHHANVARVLARGATLTG